MNDALSVDQRTVSRVVIRVIIRRPIHPPGAGADNTLYQATINPNYTLPCPQVNNIITMRKSLHFLSVFF